MTNIRATEQKLEIRREVRRRISAMDSEAKEAAAREIFSRIEHLPHFRDAKCIALFAAMKDEVPTHDALRRWSDMGKRIVVPRVEGDIMRFYDYSPDTMQEGAFGIMEPTSNDEITAENIDLCAESMLLYAFSCLHLQNYAFIFH